MAAEKKSPQKIVTEKIVELLAQKNLPPWQQPWISRRSGVPKNGTTLAAYRGCNRFLLSLASHASGYTMPAFATYKQWAGIGRQVKAGEKALPVVFASPVTKANKDANTTNDEIRDTFFVYRLSHVFNVDQTVSILPNGSDSVYLDKLKDSFGVQNYESFEHTPMASAEKIIKENPMVTLAVKYSSGRAYYSPSLDYVSVPPIADYAKKEEYYTTLFHELAHATGHETRLNRHKPDTRFGSDVYTAEELIAEFAAAQLCAIAGIENTTDNSASYIASWLNTLKRQPEMLAKAITQSEKIVEYMTNTKNDLTI